MEETNIYSAKSGEPARQQTFKESANTLFNFMFKYEYLENAIDKMKLMPRYVNENVDYLSLNSGQQTIHKISIPMLCFCDINFHRILAHCKLYGSFGIGLAKSKVTTKDVQPVTYLSEGSPLTSDISKGINSLLNGGEKREGIAGDALLTTLKFSKPVMGLQSLHGKPEEWTVFHDEHEWRYIPRLNPNVSVPLLIDCFPDDVSLMSDDSRSRLSAELQSHKNNNMKLTSKNINYIIVKDGYFAEKLLDFIENRFSDRHLQLELASKIIDLSILKEDW